MSTPLKMALIGLFTLSASALFSQSWTTAFEDDEMDISVSQLTCDQEAFLIFKITNKTNFLISPKFEVSYRQGGADFTKEKGNLSVPANSSVETDCSLIANYMEMIYEPLPASHVVEADKVIVKRL